MYLPQVDDEVGSALFSAEANSTMFSFLSRSTEMKARTVILSPRNGMTGGHQAIVLFSFRF